jgi:hypothetical protein
MLQPIEPNRSQAGSSPAPASDFVRLLRDIAAREPQSGDWIDELRWGNELIATCRQNPQPFLTALDDPDTKVADTAAHVLNTASAVNPEKLWVTFGRRSNGSISVDVTRLGREMIHALKVDPSPASTERLMSILLTWPSSWRAYAVGEIVVSLREDRVDLILAAYRQAGQDGSLQLQTDILTKVCDALRRYGQEIGSHRELLQLAVSEGIAPEKAKAALAFESDFEVRPFIAPRVALPLAPPLAPPFFPGSDPYGDDDGFGGFGSF